MKNFIKEGQKLPLYGIGPFLALGMVLISIAGVILFQYVFKAGIATGTAVYFFIAFAVLFICYGVFVWFKGALKSDMNNNISENKLKTDGIYAFVRNPMYSGIWLTLTGITLFWHNYFLLIVPFINQLLMTIVLKNSEEKWLKKLYGQEYIDYCKKVNRCIPFFQSKIKKGWIKVVIRIVCVFVLATLFLCAVSFQDKNKSTKLTIHEYGKENEKCIVLFHPSLMQWDYYSYVIPYLEENYHVIIPELPGYDMNQPKVNFTSIEAICNDLENWLLENGYTELESVYGCSMGGSMVLRMIADNRIKINKAVADGGITPYQMPWFLSRWIALKDWLLINAGKIGGVELLEKAFAADGSYTKEDLQYVVNVLNFVSSRTIWNTFDSCNNYKMPQKLPENYKVLEYWMSEEEIEEREWDVDYVKKNFPDAKFIINENIGHGGMSYFRPQELAERIVSQ